MTNPSTDGPGTNPDPSADPPRGSRLIGAIVAPAVKLWLRSQVESAADIQVALTGRDRQILTGRLPEARIVARSVVYRGLHLGAIELVARAIAVNLGQVVRGQPLQLLQPIPVAADLSLSAADLAASLAAPLLAPALAEFLQPLLTRWGATATLRDPQASLSADGLILDGVVQDQPLRLQFGLVLSGPLGPNGTQQLILRDPRWLTAAGELLAALDSIALPLGEDVAIDQLTISPDRLHCSGTITVRP
ncbi:MAG: DUF2993 domain-containing protein [Oscillatoriales cyanobacterium]|nr:MAG: DUF2993 domain-containing protein [Oscillatoriales cyanobacterium]